ncbi:nucleotidyltransferase domain-containing protein [Peptococcaceae bacterium]|nr:nucleotidyltransferase domain-containing protein [Peptococcaceae bacterium]
MGLKELGIFGSAVRDELKEKSDIDIVVEFERGKATFKICGLVDFLEELFSKEIDLLTPDGIENIRIKHVRDEIKETVKWET